MVEKITLGWLYIDPEKITFEDWTISRFHSTFSNIISSIY